MEIEQKWLKLRTWRAVLLGDDFSEEFTQNLGELREGRVSLDEDNYLDISRIST